MNIQYRVMKGILYPFDTIWHNYEVIGKENVPKKGALAVILNHACHLDPMHIGVKYPRELHFMAKKELFDENWFIRNLITTFNAFPINRQNFDRQTLENTLELWKNKEAILIFIEGTRTKTGELLGPKKGVSYMVFEALERGIDVKISPILFTGSYNMYPSGFIPFKKKLRLNIGKIIEPSEFYGSDLKKARQELTDYIWKEMLLLKSD